VSIVADEDPAIRGAIMARWGATFWMDSYSWQITAAHLDNALMALPVQNGIMSGAALYHCILSILNECAVWPDVQKHLRFRTDIHTATEARVDGDWILADATHDPPLAQLGLTAGHWDGHVWTERAYPAIGPVIHQDHPGRHLS